MTLVRDIKDSIAYVYTGDLRTVNTEDELKELLKTNPKLQYDRMDTKLPMGLWLRARSYADGSCGVDFRMLYIRRKTRLGYRHNVYHKDTILELTENADETSG